MRPYNKKEKLSIPYIKSITVRDCVLVYINAESRLREQVLLTFILIRKINYLKSIKRIKNSLLTKNL